VDYSTYWIPSQRRMLAHPLPLSKTHSLYRENAQEGTPSTKRLTSFNNVPIGASHGLLTREFNPLKHHRLGLPTPSPRRRTTHDAAFICASPSLGSGQVTMDARGPVGEASSERTLKVVLRFGSGRLLRSPFKRVVVAARRPTDLAIACLCLPTGVLPGRPVS
jgi:hypothetical protein